MKKIKDFLLTLRGRLNWHVQLVLTIVFTFMPLAIINIPFWADILIVLACFFPYLGLLVQIVIHIWAFVVAVSAPIDFWSILCFISFGLFIIVEISPRLIRSLDVLKIELTLRRARRAEKRFWDSILR